MADSRPDALILLEYSPVVFPTCNCMVVHYTQQMETAAGIKPNLSTTTEM